MNFTRRGSASSSLSSAASVVEQLKILEMRRQSRHFESRGVGDDRSSTSSQLSTSAKVGSPETSYNSEGSRRSSIDFGSDYGGGGGEASCGNGNIEIQTGSRRPTIITFGSQQKSNLNGGPQPLNVNNGQRNNNGVEDIARNCGKGSIVGMPASLFAPAAAMTPSWDKQPAAIEVIDLSDDEDDCPSSTPTLEINQERRHSTTSTTTRGSAMSKDSSDDDSYDLTPQVFRKPKPSTQSNGSNSSHILKNSSRKKREFSNLLSKSEAQLAAVRNILKLKLQKSNLPPKKRELQSRAMKSGLKRSNSAPGCGSQFDSSAPFLKPQKTETNNHRDNNFVSCPPALSPQKFMRKENSGRFVSTDFGLTFEDADVHHPIGSCKPPKQSRSKETIDSFGSQMKKLKKAKADKSSHSKSFSSLSHSSTEGNTSGYQTDDMVVYGKNYKCPSMDKSSFIVTKDGQSIWICLVCNQFEDEHPRSPMICCDSCEDWYHFLCVGIEKMPAESDKWFCKRCMYREVKSETGSSVAPSGISSPNLKTKKMTVRKSGSVRGRGRGR